MRISVIVPLAPGETEGAGLVAALGEALPCGSEVVVAVAGADAPAWPGVRVVRSAPGRGRQLNAGAGAARGDWLWFLHADTRLLGETVPGLARFVARREAALGWFDLGFCEGGLMRVNAWGANLRSAWFGLPFGDQGFVLPADWFWRLGAYDEAGRGEDHRLAWAAKRAGLPARRVGARLLTSGRRYRDVGWARTTARHLGLTAAQAWTEWRR